MSLALIEPIARAIREERVSVLAETVSQLGASGAFDDPALFLDPRADGYARNLVWRDPANLFVIVAMTWAPGQSSALHDHGGTWGVELVVSGTMCETAYRAVDRDESGRFRFTRTAERLSTSGTLGVVVPPLDVHLFGNAGTEPAYTVHVYGGAFGHCNIFSACDDGWHRSVRTALGYGA